MINQSRITMWLNQKILLWIFNFYEITVNKLFFGYQIFIRQISHITPNNHYFGLFRQEKGPSYSPVILTFGGGAALNKSAHYGCELWTGFLIILVNKREISASKKCGSGWDRIRVRGYFHKKSKRIKESYLYQCYFNAIWKWHIYTYMCIKTYIQSRFIIIQQIKYHIQIHKNTVELLFCLIYVYIYSTCTHWKNIIIHCVLIYNAV